MASAAVLCGEHVTNPIKDHFELPFLAIGA